MAEFLEGAQGETLARDVDVQLERMESSISKQGYSDGFLAGKQTGSTHSYLMGQDRLLYLLLEIECIYLILVTYHS